MTDARSSEEAHDSGMTETIHGATAVNCTPIVGLSSGGMFLESLSRRDFTAMEDCLAPSIRFRALLPPRDVDVTGPEAMLAEFRRWFGNDEERLEMVDATVGELGARIYLRWRIRLSNSSERASRLVEQHAFATIGSHIESLNLLCSGFVPELYNQGVMP
jgi:hypothetical protein